MENRFLSFYAKEKGSFLLMKLNKPFVSNASGLMVDG
jgi:hypothetical protein